MRALGMHDGANKLYRVIEFLDVPGVAMGACTHKMMDESLVQSRRGLMGLMAVALKDSVPDLARSMADAACGKNDLELDGVAAGLHTHLRNV